MTRAARAKSSWSTQTPVNRSYSIISILTSATLLGSISCSTSTSPDVSAHHAAPSMPPAEALAKLKAGNKRFVSGRMQHPHQNAGRRMEVAKGQHPFAIVLACADSRLGPEVLFDQGLGDVFVVRVAGNVLNDENIGSIEYGVEHLGAPLIVVLGHERCGAVAAAKDTIAAGGRAPGHIQSLVKAIKPAVDQTVGQDAEATGAANVRNVVAALQQSKPILHGSIASGKFAVVGAYYDLDSGKVEFY